MLILSVERVNILNSLPGDIVNFGSVYKFKLSVNRVNSSHYPRFCNCFFVFTVFIRILYQFEQM